MPRLLNSRKSSPKPGNGKNKACKVCPGLRQSPQTEGKPPSNTEVLAQTGAELAAPKAKVAQGGAIVAQPREKDTQLVETKAQHSAR